MLMFGLRLGPDPRVVVTTTPKPVKIIRELLTDPTTVVTRGSVPAENFAITDRRLIFPQLRQPKITHSALR